MPLDGHGPGRRAIAPLDALDHTVLSPGGRAERRGQLANRLMGATVDARLDGRERVMEQTLRLDPQPVAGGGGGMIARARPPAPASPADGPPPTHAQNPESPVD